MKWKKITATLLAAAMLASFTATGCGGKVNVNASAATLDGTEISMGVANFMAQYQAAQTDLYFLSYYGEDMWNTDSGDGTTMTDSVKESVMGNLQEYYLMDAHTSDYGVELSEEEKKAITDAAAKFLADNSNEALERMGATQETVEEMLRLYKIQSKMRAAIQEEIDTNVSDEECAQKTFSYVRFDKTTAAQTATDDESASADDTETETDNKETAEQFLKSAGDDLEAAAEAEEYTVLQCSYGAGDLDEDENTTSMDVEVLKAADKLKNGETADKVIATDNSYYIIRMDSTNDKEAAKTKKESILTQRRNDKYSETVESYKEACEWKVNESEWKKVNFDELYTQKVDETDTAADDGSTQTDGTQTDDAGTQDGTQTDDAGTQDGTQTDDAGTDGTQTDDAGTQDDTQADG